MIRRRSILGLFGLLPVATVMSAARAADHVRAATAIQDLRQPANLVGDEGRVHLKWQEVLGTRLYFVTIKNRTTGVLTSITTTTCDWRFMANEMHVLRIDVKALGHDGVERNAGILSCDFAPGDPFDLA